MGGVRQHLGCPAVKGTLRRKVLLNDSSTGCRYLSWLQRAQACHPVTRGPLDPLWRPHRWPVQDAAFSPRSPGSGDAAEASVTSGQPGTCREGGFLE